ncbi:MAG TPA: hypothetical protein VKX16_19785 [Chloroflexota bacterium]|nr:hypothetical protein [Chloroflexota bacterium]
MPVQTATDPRKRWRGRISSTLLVVLLGWALLPAPAIGRSQSAAGVLTAVTLRLHVSGTVPAAMTFWIAFGPLDGRFHVVQLHRSTPGVYRVTRSLPAYGRTIFAYVAGHGVLSTRAGPAPGNPVITIAVIGPASPRVASAHHVTWHVPIG